MASTLSSLISPMSWAEFHDTVYCRNYVHIQGGSEKFDGLFGWADLNHLTNGLHRSSDHIRFVAEGDPSRRVTVAAREPQAVVANSLAGLTMIVRDIDRIHAGVGNLVSGLSAEIGETVCANLYVSQPGRQGFDVHFDTHDVLVIQLEGVKRWRVFPPTVAFPLQGLRDTYPGIKPPSGDPLAELELRRGDVLYIPKGFWHDAFAHQDECMHLTVGLHVRTGYDFCKWIVEGVMNDVRFRTPLPLALQGETEGGALAARVRSQLEAVAGALAEVCAIKDLPERYHKSCVTQEQSRHPVNFPVRKEYPAEIDDDSRFSRPADQRFVIEENGEGVELAVWGRCLVMSAEMSPALRRIFKGVEFRFGDLVSVSPDLDRSDLVALVRALLRERLILPVTAIREGAASRRHSASQSR
jgi:ribosomal protein L16 Arg81 hydroxylase